MAENNAPTEQLDPAATDITSANARDGAAKRRDPSEPAAVVGLGASAGGIGVLQQFFTDMPADTGLAFVVVMHLSPEHESHLASVLQQKTRMPVTQVNETVKVRPNHVYVIPPNHQLAFEDGMLRLVPPQQAIGKRITIDLFFRTLAQSYGQRALCVVLSGSDSDGSIGVKHVRAQGGVTIAQDPNEAEHNSMPLTAISTGMVDWVLPVSQMPAKLMEFVRNEHAMRLPPEIPEADAPDVKAEDAPGGETVSDETRAPQDESALGDVLAFLHGQTGHDFSHYKRATVLRRIARRLQVNSLETIPAYLDFLRKHPTEASALLHDLLICVTHFFRDQESFAALEANIPQLFAGKSKNDQLRVWVAGCATGEEAYSIAMLLCEHADRLESPPTVQVFATDLDEQSIHEARDGLYPLTIEADVSQERLRRFFTRDHGRYRVRKSLREKVLFAAHNVLSDAPFSRVDLVSCRNLLIYLNVKAQEQVFDIFHFALRSGGLLFIGGAENIPVQSLFSAVDPKHRIYVRQSVPRPSWKIPILPLRARGVANRGRIASGGRRLPPLEHDAVEDASSRSDGALFAGQERRAALFGELHLKLLEQYAPPSVVVNEQHEIVHLSEKAGRYLRLAAGEPSADLFKLIRPELQIELRTALFRASRGEEMNVIGTPQTVQFESGSETIVLQVRRVAGSASEKFFLVLFQQAAEEAQRATAPAHDGAVTRGLDDEIQHLKGQLATTVEQYEGANEELKASNEELQAMNEEMRSATEELETSKEELQSVNEELTTVNNELKSSVEELSRANTDLTNLMASTDIGTVFLDRQLRIYRFTPSAQKIFNLLATDLGRPLADITHKLQYDGLFADCEQVLDRLSTLEREVPVAEHEPATDGREGAVDEKRWYLLRIAPYRTQEDRIAGVVATFIDITRRKRAEDELRESEGRLRRTLEIETVGVIFFTTEGDIEDANSAFLRMSGYTRDDLAKRRLRWDTMTAPEFMERSLEAVEEFKRTGKTTTYEKQYIRKDGSRWWGLFSATRLTENLGVEFILDISDRKQTEHDLQASETRFRTVADNVPQVIWTNDAQGDAVYFNRRFLDYTGLSYEELRGPGWMKVVHPDDAAASIERWQVALAAGEVFDTEYRLRSKQGDYRWFIGRNVPLRENGNVINWFGSATDIDDLKRAEARLRESEQRYQLLVEGTPDYAMFLLDENNVITYWSAGAEKVFGWSAEEAVGQTGAMIFTPEDRKKGEAEKELAIALQDGRAPDRRWHLRKDGSRLWVDGVMRRVDRQTGELRGFAKIGRDATDLHNAEEKLLEAHSQLERRVRDRTRELQAMNETLEAEMAERKKLEHEILQVTERERARISQDLHDSLCQELTATAFLLKSQAKSVGKESSHAATALGEAAETVNANAGLARDLARGLHPFELGSGGLVNALRELATRTNERVSCKCECPRSLRVPSHDIALNLYRVAQEAVLNAVKHAKASEIVICIERAGDEIVMSVKDNGTGGVSSKRSSGMGIHMMQYRANASGGTLTIESKRGRGSKVTCRVPAKH